MNITKSPASRILCRTLAVILANAIVPFGVPQMVINAWPASHKAPAKKVPVKSHFLSSKDMKRLQGKTGENPYLAGQSKWDVMVKGVDLITGNYMTSATDLDFEAGYGIPVNVTRSYSANCADEGPFGKGWTLSADVRSTAGGLLKGPSAPVRTVPANIAEQPPKEFDPNAVGATGNQGESGSGAVGQQAAAQPVQAVVSTDAGGTAETIQKDVDGILTTPPWDDNVHNAIYQYVNFQGNVYQLTYSDTMSTIDGTTYTYQAEGTYQNQLPSLTTCGQMGGTEPYDASQMSMPPPPTPANILKVTLAVDRQGNQTSYTYGGSTGPSSVSFNKSDGVTTEAPLTSVLQMPNGHQLIFSWGNSGSGTANRITSVTDNAGRTVTYGYGGFTGGPNNIVTSVTSPQGRVTTYGYGGAYASTDWTNNEYPVAGSLLTSITSPQGLTTNIHYEMAVVNVLPYQAQVLGVVAYRVDDPNGLRTYIYNSTNPLPTNDDPCNPPNGAPIPFPGNVNSSGILQIMDWGQYSNWAAGSGQGVLINAGILSYNVQAAANNVTVTEVMTDGLTEQRNNIAGYNYYYRWAKAYDGVNMTLTTDDEANNQQQNPFQYQTSNLYNPHSLVFAPWYQQDVITSKQYNFMGNPLTSTVTETQTAGNFNSPTTTTTRVAETQYAYWNSTKYYQQMATLDPAGRYTYTDYYPNTGGAGSRGQTYEVFSPAFTTFNNTAATDPRWQYDLVPATGSPFSAQFVYDSVGRATDVYKLQTISGGTANYVHTTTTYGSNRDGSWGEASQVVEDAGGINRTTTTNAYTSYGKADDVTDAAGHRFVTSYDLDGLVNSVTRTDTGTNQVLVTYAYGSSGVTNAMPTLITDGLSGVTQSIYYDSNADGGIGQVQSVTETNGSDVYSTAYTYDGAGNRTTATYTTPQQPGTASPTNTTAWAYTDYTRVGTADSPKYAFQTLTKLDSGGNPTSEAMHYLYDASGRIEDAAFAQTPTATGITANGSWYDYASGANFAPATSRARAFYSYDPAGRMTEVDHYWDTWNTTNNNWNASQYIVGNACTYEVQTGLNRGLKTEDSYLTQESGTPTSPTVAWTQSYGYDPNLDYLTSANYGDSQPNPNQTWTYDAAGNRTSDYTGSGWTYDNLNRMTASPGLAYTNDIMGNRLTLDPSGDHAGTYTWDSLSRLVATTQPAPSRAFSRASVSYQYRADGMRVEKTDVSGDYDIETGEPDDQYAWYRYDGQMPIETSIIKADSSTEVIDNGLGARGLDYVHIVTTPTSGSATTTVAFPIYDAHGNEVATLSRSGSSYALNNQRSYGAWGEVRQGSTTGGPRGRYCGNLGHVQDDETGLIYMCARYYESSSGRFISEDVAQNGFNYFIYCSNSPTNKIDPNGKSAYFSNTWYGFLGAFSFGASLALTTFAWALAVNESWKASAYVLSLGVLAAAASLDLASGVDDNTKAIGTLFSMIMGSRVIQGLVGAVAAGLGAAKGDELDASIDVIVCAAYCVTVIAALADLMAGN